MHTLTNEDFLLPPSARARTVTAILGPTNTGKTHLAIERMLGHKSGMIGLPLRLLAREVYNRITARIGEDKVALITGEEKIKPAGAKYFVCTVEAMPLDVDVDFLAIDEVQLAADFARGHVFTDRILFRRAVNETLILGAATIRPLIEKLLPGVNILARPRLSQLTYAGQTKISRLPRRTAIIAFSAAEVYTIAELIRSQRGGAAVVLGALSPRTRNAQVAMYQDGEVDHLVATDAIGMGLNLDIDHVAFAAFRKFDGHQFRMLNPAEMAQIAGRAGRHLKDGSFGVTGSLDPFDAGFVERLEGHNFDPLKILQWRNPRLQFASLASLKESLAQTPSEPGLSRAPTASDEMVLDFAARDADVAKLVSGPDEVSLLWDTCQLPDYRKIAPAHHADIVTSLFQHLVDGGRIPDDWFAKQVAFADRTDGDIDTLSNRISHIRTWTFVANRPDWLTDPEDWQNRTRAIEDRLSDALHERLTQRFVDRRTSILMRRLRDNSELEMTIGDDGDVFVEKHFVGRLKGFVFSPDLEAGGTEGKALRAAALKALATEIATRAGSLAGADDKDITLADNGGITWRGDEVARLTASENNLRPRVQLALAEQLQADDRERIIERLESWLNAQLETRIGSLLALAEAKDLAGISRGIAFRLAESFGSIQRKTISDDVRNLSKEDRAALRSFGVRFGAHAIYVPALLKPAGADMIRLLWHFKTGGGDQTLGLLPRPASQGLMSLATEKDVPDGYYQSIGYHVYSGRAVRIDMLERLADEVREILSWRPASDDTTAPEGWHAKGKFVSTPRMMSLIGAGAEELSSLLRALGFHGETITAPEASVEKPVETEPVAAETAPEQPTDATQPVEADATLDDDPKSQPPATLTVWRVARPNRNRGQSKKSGNSQDANKTRRGPDRNAAKGKPAKPGKPAQTRAAAKPDPNSPFAALAGLKKDLEKSRPNGNQPDAKKD